MGNSLEIISWLAMAVVGLLFGAVFLIIFTGLIIATIRTIREGKNKGRKKK